MDVDAEQGVPAMPWLGPPYANEVKEVPTMARTAPRALSRPV